MSNSQKFIQRARLALHDQRREAARARADAKKLAEQASAKVNLLLDDLAQEGIDVTTDYGKAVLFSVLTQKIAAAGKRGKGPLSDGDLFFRD